MEKKKKKERGDARSPRTLTYVTALDSFRCATPRVISSNRIVFFKPESIVFPYPRITNDITNEITGAPLSIFLNNRSTCYLLDVLTKTNKKKKEKASLSLGTNGNDRKVNKRSR